MDLATFKVGSKLTLQHSTYAELINEDGAIVSATLLHTNKEPLTGEASSNGTEAQSTFKAPSTKLAAILEQLKLNPVLFKGETVAGLARSHGVSNACINSRLERLRKKMKLSKQPAKSVFKHFQKVLA